MHASSQWFFCFLMHSFVQCHLFLDTVAVHFISHQRQFDSALLLEIGGEAHKISVLQYRGEDDAISFKILVGFGHLGDESCFNHLVGFDVSAETLKGNLKLN